MAFAGSLNTQLLRREGGGGEVSKLIKILVIYVTRVGPCIVRTKWKNLSRPMPDLVVSFLPRGTVKKI